MCGSWRRDVNGMNYDWEPLADGVHRCRLPFLDVTVGLVLGHRATLLIDCGTTLTEARSIDADVRTLADRFVTHVVLTHHHFDHVLGSSVFADAEVYTTPAVAYAMSYGSAVLRADAVRYGADPADVAAAVAALRPPRHQTAHTRIDLGGRMVTVAHPGRGHTDHDLMVVLPPLAPAGRVVVFCGDLVEESGDPAVGPESDLTAWPDTLDRLLEAGGDDGIYVPGHGAVVDAEFVRRQQGWLRGFAV
jgi:glyoxylase-like metal-dependent hydrolase (beta-lactamase superfamily II)